MINSAEDRCLDTVDSEVKGHRKGRASKICSCDKDIMDERVTVGLGPKLSSVLGSQ